MANLRGIAEWLDIFKNAVSTSEVEELTDFSAGSMLDAYAVVAASTGQEIQRMIARAILKTFIKHADGPDLHYLALDRYGVEPHAGEGDEDFRERILDWLSLTGAPTLPGITFFATRWVDAVKNAVVTEDYAAGLGAIAAVAEDDGDAVALLADFESQIDQWRPFGVPVNIEVTGGA